MIEKIIFGDNQFFGVNHMSETKSQQQQEKFSKLENIIKVIDSAIENGANGFMLHSHSRAKEICEYFRKHKGKYFSLTIYPAIPHPVKYMEMVTDVGLLPAVFEIIRNSSISDFSSMIFKGGLGLASKDLVKLMKLLIDIELQPFKGLKIGAVFLQNIATDLALSMGMSRLLKEFHDYIVVKYNVEAAFQTANLPYLVNILKETGVENPIIMSPINKAGFFMNPNKAACENVIQNEKIRLIPMSVLASGSISPKEAFSYVFSLRNISSIIFGASTTHHIKNSIQLIREFQ